MTNVNADGELSTPNGNYCFAYVTGSKAAQNDTITVSNFSVIYDSHGVVEPTSGDSATETVTVDDSTKNMINLTGAATGTFHGYVIGVPA